MGLNDYNAVFTSGRLPWGSSSPKRSITSGGTTCDTHGLAESPRAPYKSPFSGETVKRLGRLTIPKEGRYVARSHHVIIDLIDLERHPRPTGSPPCRGTEARGSVDEATPGEDRWIHITLRSYVKSQENFTTAM